MRTYTYCLAAASRLLGVLIIGFSFASIANAQVLTPAVAVEKTLLHSPALQSFPYQQRAIEADVIQAGLKPNPTLHADLENVFGTGNSRFLSGAELTLSLSQLIEMGDKRQQRINVANARMPALQQQYEVQRLDVVAQTLRHFYQALRLDALLEWNQQRIKQEQAALNVIEFRADAGAVGTADVLRMQLRLARSENQQKQLRNERQLAYQKLAANWAGTVDFDALTGELAVLPAVPETATLNEAISQTPAYLQVHALSRLREAQISLAEAQAEADITVGAGVRRLEGVNDNALVFSFSMPLQFHNRNQGNIARANAEYQQELQAMQLTVTQIELALAEIRIAMQNNLALSQSLKNDLQPIAKALLDSTAEGYELGQYSVLQWVDAQSELFAVERELIEAQTAVHLQMLELERLTGNVLSQSSASNDLQE
ncbi:MAG TPA: TolC family protein [Methylophaga sp.]|nr:TolC family protein [Methylophaga sp.]